MFGLNLDMIKQVQAAKKANVAPKKSEELKKVMSSLNNRHNFPQQRSMLKTIPEAQALALLKNRTRHFMF